jgi:L,D-transpeptidase-like protein
VSEEFAKKYKRIGRSEGCPALDHKYSRTVIDQLKQGSFLILWKTP